jgi:hypothetical protein
MSELEAKLAKVGCSLSCRSSGGGAAGVASSARPPAATRLPDCLRTAAPLSSSCDPSLCRRWPKARSSMRSCKG